MLTDCIYHIPEAFKKSLRMPDDNQSSMEDPEFPRQQPYEYEGEDSILSPNSPCARSMPIPKPLQCTQKFPRLNLAIPAPLKVYHSVVDGVALDMVHHQLQP